MKILFLVFLTLAVMITSTAQIFIPFGNWIGKRVTVSAIPNTDGPQNVSVSQNFIFTSQPTALACAAPHLQVTSSNIVTVPLANISFSGIYPNCKITLYSTLNSGTSTITVTAKNEFNATATTSFLFTAYQSPVMAFSFRKVVKSYLGMAMRVRRVSDNVESDIGFDGSGNFDLAAYNTFKGASSVTIRTWYDQSGNGYNANQTVNATQPTITIAGFNGAPQVEFSGLYRLETTAAQNIMSLNRDLTVFFATKATTFNQVNYGVVSGSINDRVLIHVNWSDNNVYWDAPGPCCGTSRLSYGNAANVNVPKVYVFGRNNAFQYLKINGTTVASINTASGNLQAATAAQIWYLGAAPGGDNAQSPLAEYVQYLSGLTNTQVDSITNEQKNYFGL